MSSDALQRLAARISPSSIFGVRSVEAPKPAENRHFLGVDPDTIANIGAVSGVSEPPATDRTDAAPSLDPMPADRRQPSFWIEETYDPNRAGNRCVCCRGAAWWCFPRPDPAMPGQTAWRCHTCHPPPPARRLQQKLHPAVELLEGTARAVKRKPLRIRPPAAAPSSATASDPAPYPPVHRH
jgi:hypothetical protein